MRYSKKKKITIAVISVLCFLFVAFIIFKGINDSRKLTDDTSNDVSKPNVTANVSLVDKVKKKFSKKKDTKKEKTTEKKSKIAKSAKDEVEVEKEEVKEDEVGTNLTGYYTITSLKLGDKKYSNEEIKKLKANGYSLELSIKKDGTANLSVLYIDKVLSYDSEYFTDGDNKIKYTSTKNKIKFKLDDAEMVFKKE